MNPIFLLGHLQLWTSWLRVIHQTPINCCPKLVRFYVAGFPVMVLFLWSFRLDKHNLVIFEWGDFSLEVCPFHFCWTNSLTADHQDKKLSGFTYCVYNYSSAKGKFNSLGYLVQCPLETKNDSVMDESQPSYEGSTSVSVGYSWRPWAWALLE
jgi:hypothetical protein